VIRWLALLGVFLLVLIFAPTTIANVTGRPLYVDCGGLEADVCDQAWRRWVATDESGELPDPVTWVAIEPISGTCGAYTFGAWWPYVDPFAIVAQPLC